MNPYLSIIVPIYKVETYLNQCIDSILGQTFENFELILVNDGSPDNCPYICNEYEKQDKRIKVIHKLNGGLVSARKAGLKVARGKYIGYVDGDDWIEKDMYEQLYKAANLYKCDITICDAIQSYKDKEIKYKQVIKPGLYDKNSMKKLVYPFMLYSGVFYKFGLYPALWNKLFKRELLEKNQFNVNEQIRMGEDVACTYPCLFDANSIYILDNKYLYHYRQVASSMTKSYDPLFFDRLDSLIDELNNSINNKVIYNFSTQMNYYIAYLTLGAINNVINSNNKKSLREKAKFISYNVSSDYIKNALQEIKLNHLPMKNKICIWLLRSKLSYLLVLIIFMKNKLKIY